MTQASHEIPRQDPQDVLVDKGSATSYTEARDMLGLPQPDSADFTFDAISKRIAAQRSRGDAHDYYSREFHLTGPINLSPEERAATAERIQAVKDEIRPLGSRPE